MIDRRMSRDWREQHFGIPEGPTKLRDNTPEKTARWPYAVLALLIISPISAVGVAYYLGIFDPPAPEIIEHETFRDHVVTVAEKPKVQPRTLRPMEGRPMITSAKANELQRMIESRDRGLELLNRDHAKVKAAFDAAAKRLSTAEKNLVIVQSSRPPLSDSAGSYRWSIANNDAVSAVNNAKAEYKRQQSLNDGFIQRIAKATKERDEAREILDTHDIEDAN